MQWSDLEHFLHMEGHGAFVWASYGVCALAVAIEVLAVRARMRRAVAEVAARAGGDGSAR